MPFNSNSLAENYSGLILGFGSTSASILEIPEPVKEVVFSLYGIKTVVYTVYIHSADHALPASGIAASLARVHTLPGGIVVVSEHSQLRLGLQLFIRLNLNPIELT